MAQKENVWLEERRDEFLRDIIQQFFDIYLKFNESYQSFRKDGKIKFSLLSQWVGTEDNKGPLWNFKDLVHNLLDRPHQFLTHEIAFERAIHLIFHQFMSFKEHIYVLEQYENIAKERFKRVDEELSGALKDFQKLMMEIRVEMPGEIDSAKELFDTSAKLLRLSLPSYRDNKLVIRYLVENKDKVERVYGKGEWKKILERIFNKKLEKAYYLTAQWYFENGDYSKAVKYLKEAGKLNPSSKEIKNLSKKVSAFSAER